MKKFFQHLYTSFWQSGMVKAIRAWAKRSSVSGFKGVSIYDVTMFIWNEWRSSVITSRANGIAFSFFMSLFPTIIVLFTLVAYTPFYSNFNELIRDTVHDLMPGNAEKWVLETIKDLTTIKRKGWLSVGFFLALYFSTNGMVAMMSGFEKAYKGTFRRYDFFQKRWIAIQLTILLGFLLFGSVILGILGDTFVQFLTKIYKNLKFATFLLTVFRYLLMVILLYGGLSVIYRMGMPLRKKLPLINPGVTLATILSLLTSIFFSFYVDNFGNYNKLYGSLGALIVLLLWLQLNIYIVLIGFELNASIAVNRDIRDNGLS
jgi:membrane protein